MGNSDILILPAVSSGNIAQLATDLFIHTLKAHYVQSLDDRYLYPFVGPQDRVEGDSPREEISTPADVYKAPGYTIIQLRSPTIPGFRQRFVRDTLLPFIDANKFKQVVILGSSNAALRPEHPGQASVQLFSESLADQLSGLSLNAESPVHPTPKELPESGIVLDILKTISPSLAIVAFAYEGDNFGDAENLATHAAQVLNAPQQQWVRPISWKRAYGKDVPLGAEEGLYS